MQIEERIGKRLREARERNRLTQEEFGELVTGFFGNRWSKQTVSAAEAGGRDFDAEELLVLAILLKKPIYWFFGLGDGTTVVSREGGKIVTDLEETLADADKVQLPNGVVLSESSIQQATGRPSKEAVRLAGVLRNVAREVESLRPQEETKQAGGES